jgi:hypothetical protein
VAKLGDTKTNTLEHEWDGSGTWESVGEEDTEKGLENSEREIYKQNGSVSRHPMLTRKGEV